MDRTCLRRDRTARCRRRRELEVGSGKSYALTLILRDGEASARRRLELELSPPVLSALDRG